MVPRLEGPTSRGVSSEADGRPAEARDRVRFAVQLALAIYLSPVLLLVCLVGGTSILVNGMAHALRHGLPDPPAAPKLGGRAQGKALGGLAGLDRNPDVGR